MLRNLASTFISITFVFAVLGHAKAAEPSKQAQDLITEGLELRRAGQDNEALPKFEEGYRLSPTPRAAAQWGLCLQAVGRWSEADARLAEALKAKNDPWVVKNRSILKESLEQVKQNVARVEVYGGPDGATVTINGKAAGTYPLPGAVAVNAGNVDIEVTKPGLKRGYRAISIAGGQYQRVLIRLDETEKAAPAVAAAPAPVPTVRLAQSTEPEGSIVSSPAETPSIESTPVYKKPWFWVCIGAVVAGGALAFALSSGGGGEAGPKVDDRGTFGQ